MHWKINQIAWETDMPDGCDILLTDARGECGMLVASSLRARGLRVEVLEAPKAGRYEADFMRALRSAVEKLGPRVIMPVFFPEIVAEHREEFPGVIVAAGDAAVIRTLDNKVSASELASGLGIPQPRRFSSVEDVDEYPVVFKRPNGQGGDSVYFPKSREALERLLSTARGHLITEYVSGQVHCVDALRWGSVFRSSSYRVLEPVGKGISTKREHIAAPQLEKYLETMLKAVDYQGVCGADFIIAPDGRPYFLECNPRFSGGLSTAIENGFDIPYEYYLCLTG